MVESVKEKGTYGIYDVESFFRALDQLHGSFSDIDAHQDLQKSNFVMPELLIKELWAGSFLAELEHLLTLKRSFMSQ